MRRLEYGSEEENGKQKVDGIRGEGTVIGNMVVVKFTKKFRSKDILMHISKAIIFCSHLQYIIFQFDAIHRNHLVSHLKISENLNKFLFKL